MLVKCISEDLSHIAKGQVFSVEKVEGDMLYINENKEIDKVHKKYFKLLDPVKCSVEYKKQRDELLEELKGLVSTIENAPDQVNDIVKTSKEVISKIGGNSND